MTKKLTEAQKVVKAAMEFAVTFSNGVTVLNVTPHELTFLDGETVVNVPCSGIIITAGVVEQPTPVYGQESSPANFVKTRFVGEKAGYDLLEVIVNEYKGILPIGSIIAAQAFPGCVFGMIPAPGFERVHPTEKRMSISKFTTF